MVLATKWPAPTGLTSGRSSAVKTKLDALELVENEDFSELRDVSQLRPQGGTSIKKIYRREAPSPLATADSRSFQKNVL